MIGTCPECGRLVPIVSRGLRFGESRQRNWYPVAHESEGRPCPGDRRSIE